MSGMAYTPAVVTNKPKIYGVAAEGEAPTTGGRCVQRQGTRTDIYSEESKVDTDLHVYTGML